MRLTPFKQGRIDGLHTSLTKRVFKGRRSCDYITGYLIGSVKKWDRVFIAAKASKEAATRDTMHQLVGS